MSFDLFLCHFQNAEAGRIDDTARNAMLGIIKAATDSEPDDFGFYALEFADNSHLELNAKGLSADEDAHGCSFHLRAMTQAVFEFVHAMAHAGDMTVINPQADGDAPIFYPVSAAQLPHLPETGIPAAAICGTAAELARALGSRTEAWIRYRDQVLREHDARRSNADPRSRPSAASLTCRHMRA